MHVMYAGSCYCYLPKNKNFHKTNRKMTKLFIFDGRHFNVHDVSLP